MSSSPVKVLLIDDDQDIYVMTRDLLAEVKDCQYTVDWVATYDEALEAVGSNNHDVYLVDYRLGEHNGLDFLRDAIRIGCRAPLILLTGLGDRQVDLEAMEAGAADYLSKGQLDASLLERSIRYSLERSRVEKERVILEQQLLHSQKMEAVGQLAGGLAHNLNNLLTAILGYAQLGSTKLPAENRLQTYFHEIQKAALRASDLTRQLLAFSRREVVEMKVFDLNDLVFNTHTLLRRLIGENIELVTIAAPSPGLVKADPNQLEQVLVNMAVNARDAMPGVGKLTVETTTTVLDHSYASRHAEVKPGEYVLLSITDDGVGIAEDVKARIFEPFFTTKEHGKGTGLGLSTCYGIIKQCGGHIAFESEPGEGTVFKIYLPRVDQVPAGRHVAESSGPLPRGKEMVLLVEDEETVRGMVARVLRQQGYTVLEAVNGRDAIQVVQNRRDKPVDLLLTDIVMPSMGGRELAYRLKAAGHVRRVLYTSGYTDATVYPDQRLGPASDFISKPFTPYALARRVRDVLDYPVRGWGVDGQA